jgi:hypothetical protein
MKTPQLIYFLFIFSFLSAGCDKPIASEEIYTALDFKLKLEALNHRNKLIKKFNDTIPNSKYDYYYLIYFNAFNEGNSIKFIKKGDRYYLTEKIRDPQDSVPILTAYTTEIYEDEWACIENMVNDFDFWTEKQFKHNRALDGFHFYLEVNNSTDKERTHRIVGRASPHYDKIGALCQYIIRFKEVCFMIHEPRQVY